MKQIFSQFFSVLMLAVLILTACEQVNANITLEEPATVEVVEPKPTSEIIESQHMYEFVLHEQARDLAVAFVAQRAGIEAPVGSWSMQDETPEGLVGSSAFLYTNGPWVVQVSAQVVASDYLTYTVLIDNLSAIFRWEGTVDVDGKVIETNFVQDSTSIQGPVLAEESWIGVVVANPPGSQFDDYFQMMDQNGTRAGIEGETDEINAQLLAYRDTGQTIQVWGILVRDVPDAYGMQIRVTRIELY